MDRVRVWPRHAKLRRHILHPGRGGIPRVGNRAAVVDIGADNQVGYRIFGIHEAINIPQIKIVRTPFPALLARVWVLIIVVVVRHLRKQAQVVGHFARRWAAISIDEGRSPMSRQRWTAQRFDLAAVQAIGLWAGPPSWPPHPLGGRRCLLRAVTVCSYLRAGSKKAKLNSEQSAQTDIVLRRLFCATWQVVPWQ